MNGRTCIRSTLAALIALILSACLDREEKIWVHRDGSVTMQVTVDAESSRELAEAGALPSDLTGWAVIRDEEKFDLTGFASFGPPAAELPSNFAAPEDPFADRYVQFPTTVRRETTAEGVYYHFRRVYPQVSWARGLARMHHYLEDLEESEFEEMPDSQQTVVARGFVELLWEHRIARARHAFADLTLDTDERAWSLLERGLGDYAALVTPELFVAVFEEGDEEDFEEAWEADEEALREALLPTLVEVGLDRDEVSRFWTRYDWYTRRLDRMENENWDILLELPGEIVETNSTDIVDGTVRWRFSAYELGDRTIEMTATSFVRGS